MRYMDSIFVSLLKPIDRRQFGALVERQDGDAYDKSFKSWDHLVALLYAQFSHAGSLRGVVTGFNANDHHHYHLGVGKLSRSIETKDCQKAYENMKANGIEFIAPPTERFYGIEAVFATTPAIGSA